MQSFNDVRMWEDEEHVILCRKCKTEFGLLTWKHHCRACGKVFCDFCSCFYRSIPPSELCPDAPVDWTQTDPQRCCEECSERIKHLQAQERQQRYSNTNATRSPHQHIHEYNEIPTVDSMELIQGRPTRLYIIQLPAGTAIYAEQTIRVELDGAINHIVVPYGVGPGDVLYVRANAHSPPVVDTSRVQIITEIYIVNVEPAAGATPPDRERPTVAEPPAPPQVDINSGAFIECPQCTYQNLLQAEVCAMCETSLVD